MKLLVPLGIALALTSCNTLSDSVDWVDYGDDPMQNEQYMIDMTEAGTPGPEHSMLASHAGDWNVAGQIWMEPGAPPMPMNATASTEVLLGGRYIVEEFRSDFMGMPFEGRLMQGYDNVTGKYWSIWTDNMSTGCWLTEGTQIAPGVIEYHGTAKDILTPNGRPMRMTTRDNGDGSHTMRMYDTRKGEGEFQSMELTYTR